MSLAPPSAGSVGQRIGSGFEFTEGPLWLTADDAARNGLGEVEGLYFSDIDGDSTYFATSDALVVVRHPSARSNGNALDRSGRIISCEHDGRRVSRRVPPGDASGDGDEWETVIGAIDGRRLNSPNDLCCRADGTILFTDPPYGVDETQRDMDVQGVYAVDDRDSTILIDGSRIKPNGIAVDPGDDAIVWLADTELGEIVRYRLSPDLVVTSTDIFGGFERPDGLAFDASGNVLVAVVDGIAVLDVDTGEARLLIEMDERPANLCVVDGTLYVCARTTVWRFDLSPSSSGGARLVATGDRVAVR